MHGGFCSGIVAVAAAVVAVVAVNYVAVVFHVVVVVVSCLIADPVLGFILDVRH